MEQCPSEVFIHVSASRCWDMVRERVNNEIKKQHNMGRLNLPLLQPPGSIDGLEMFGLSSPTVIQARHFLLLLVALINGCTLFGAKSNVFQVLRIMISAIVTRGLLSTHLLFSCVSLICDL